jgi:hypothetical protein
MTLSPLATVILTASQQAAAAKLAVAIDGPGGVALLCGPQGVGTSTVLSAVAQHERHRGRTAEHRDVTDWLPAAVADDLPDVVVVDVAHRAAAGDLARLVAVCRRRAAPARLVLAGEGRLLTLVSRDTAVERAIHLRASLRPLPVHESRTLIARVLARGGIDAAKADAVVEVIHEIGGGIPAAMLRLAELAAVVATSQSERTLEPRDIEAIHRRLSPLAA